MQVTAEKIYSIEEYLQFEETADNKHEYNILMDTFIL